MALVVEEARRWIADRGWILIEDRPSGAGGRRVDDAVRRRMLHHVVERGAPVVQPQVEAGRALFTDELLVGGIQAKPDGRELRDLRGQLGHREVPPAQLAQDLELLPEVGERGRGLLPSVVEPAGEEEERRLR